MRIVYIILFTFLFSSCDYIKSSSDAESNDTPEEKEKIYNGVRKNYIKGKLASTVTYKDSLKNGPAINYYPDGKVNMEFTYKDGKKDGPYKWYYENGKIYIEGQYKEGEKDGLFKMYRKNGNLKAEMPWHNGMACVGLKEYFDSGNEKPVPSLIIKQKNTIRLDNLYTLEIKLSEKVNGAKFFEGSLGENESFSDYYPPLNTEKGKAIKQFYVSRGQVIMQTITIIAKIKTKDNNFHIITKKVNLSIENRF